MQTPMETGVALEQQAVGRAGDVDAKGRHRSEVEELASNLFGGLATTGRFSVEVDE